MTPLQVRFCRSLCKNRSDTKSLVVQLDMFYCIEELDFCHPFLYLSNIISTLKSKLALIFIAPKREKKAQGLNKTQGPHK